MISVLQVPSRTEECVHVAKTFLRSALRSRPLYGLAGHALWEAYNRRVEFSEKSPVLQGQIYRTDFSVIRKRLPRLDSIIRRQRANADYFASTLDLGSTALCQERPDTFYNRYQYPLTFPSQEHRDFMAAYLQKRQIDTIKPLQDAAEVGIRHYAYKGDCPATEQLSKRVLVIPNYHTLKKYKIENIVRCLNQGWAELSSNNPRIRPATTNAGSHGEKSVDVKCCGVVPQGTRLG